MSPSGRLCLLTAMLVLMFPARGQDTLTPPPESNPKFDSHQTPSTAPSQPSTVQTPKQDPQEAQLTPQPPTPLPEEITPSPRESPTPSLTESDVLLTPAPGKDMQSTQATTPPKEPTRGKGPTMSPTPEDGSSDPDEDSPFYYDVKTLRKRGLLIAAVLFITGIVILTSGKCRRLPQLCQKNRR